MNGDFAPVGMHALDAVRFLSSVSLPLLLSVCVPLLLFDVPLLLPTRSGIHMNAESCFFSN